MINACLSPSSPIAFRAALIRLLSAASDTILPFQMVSSNSSLLTTRPRLRTRCTSRSIHLRLHVNDLTGAPQLLATQVDYMVTEDKTHARLLLSTSRSIIELQHKSLNRSADILQVECPKLLERKIRPLAHLITHCTRDTNTPRRTLRLKSNRYVDAVTMQVGSVRNRVADIDANAEANRSARRLIGIISRHLLLNFYSATDRAVDAVEHDQQ